MYDELKERCRACSQGCTYPSECSYFDKPPLRCMRQLLSESADAIEELSRDLDSMNEANIALYGALPKWIPVTERLPECEGERVLVASNFLTSYLRVSICYFSKNLEDVDKYDFDGEKRSGFYVRDPEYGYYERQCVQYWMPLPEPPKEAYDEN